MIETLGFSLVSLNQYFSSTRGSSNNDRRNFHLEALFRALIGQSVKLAKSLLENPLFGVKISTVVNPRLESGKWNWPSQSRIHHCSYSFLFAIFATLSLISRLSFRVTLKSSSNEEIWYNDSSKDEKGASGIIDKGYGGDKLLAFPDSFYIQINLFAWLFKSPRWLRKFRNFINNVFCKVGKDIVMKSKKRVARNMHFIWRSLLLEIELDLSFLENQKKNETIKNK